MPDVCLHQAVIRTKHEKNQENDMDSLSSSSPRMILDQAAQTWRQPKELNGSRPREVSLTKRGIFMAGVSFVMVLVGLALGIGLYVKFSRDLEAQNRVVQSGMNINAVITRHWISQEGKSPYSLEYEYQVEGKTYQGKCSVSHESWTDLVKKGSIMVRYLPSDPAKQITPGHDPELPQPWLAILYPGAFFLWAGIAVRAIVIQYQCLAEGIGAPAIVVRVRRTQHLWQKIAYYIFVDGNGTQVKGKIGPQMSPPSSGTVVNIVYKPDHEKHSTVYPAPFVQLRRI
jgi:hypothetical protein